MADPISIVEANMPESEFLRAFAQTKQRVFTSTERVSASLLSKSINLKDLQAGPSFDVKTSSISELKNWQVDPNKL